MRRTTRSFTPSWRHGDDGACNDSSRHPLLYRPKDCREALHLISNSHLYTDEEIIDFLSGDHDLPASRQEMEQREHVYNQANHPLQDSTENKLWRKAFHKRRQEIRSLAEKLDSGGATIDEDGRLVPVIATRIPQPPRANLPPPPLPGRDRNNGQNNRNDNPLLEEMGRNPEAQEQELEELLRRDHRGAAETIAREVHRLRREGLDEDTFEVIVLEPRGPETPPAHPLARRRVVVALTGIVTAFACILLHAVPLLSVPEPVDPAFDSFLYELLEVRPWTIHVQQCSDLANRNATSSKSTTSDMWYSWRRWWNKTNDSRNSIDCSDGVLHVPTNEGFWKERSSMGDKILHGSYGVDTAWFIRCVPPPSKTNSTSCGVSKVCDTVHSQQCLTEEREPFPRCFRGVHDNTVTSGDIYEAKRLGQYLIEKGGDHFDIHYDIPLLNRRLFDVIRKLKQLLRENYGHKKSGFQPLAFRLLTTGPMDGHGVRAMYPSTLNRTNYWNWVERSKHHNERAKYPWPIGVQPKRERCNLVSDAMIDPRFCILTSVSLAGGAGKDYRGAATLFLDHHPSNYRPRRRLQRGVTIDGQVGRVVVSTGGFENLRCQFPVRSGLRVDLQIWWDCGS